MESKLIDLVEKIESIIPSGGGKIREDIKRRERGVHISYKTHL